MQEALFPPSKEHIYTVSEFTQEIKDLLEGNYPTVSLLGEISNFHAHSSGHFYFTLKDSDAQISAAMFRGANRQIKFDIENGLEVIVQGRLSLYGPRGQYQIIVEHMEPKGLGALQLAFEQLKKRLEVEGLFEEERKKPLPFLPHTMGLITSPTGAALRDMVQILHRRFPLVNILLYPVHVQGNAAIPEIVQAIKTMNGLSEIDVLIVGRGGGSLEDLWAFNTEEVARAVANSRIPIVSAVGHETDFTICDFVADLRAPTPSAAAELTVPVTEELGNLLQERKLQLSRSIRRLLGEKREQLKYQKSHLKHPKQRLEELEQHLDMLKERLLGILGVSLKDRRTALNHLAEKMQVLSPLSILARGYSIVHLRNKDGSKGAVVKKASQVKKGKPLNIRLMQGEIKARVE